MRRTLTLLYGWPRRLAALLCLALAALSMLGKHSAHSPGPFVQVVVAGRARPAGAVLQPGDVRPAQWPAALVPSGAFADPTRLLGRPLAGPIGVGEPLTPPRLLDMALTASLRPGQVAATIRLADRRQATILQVGSAIDLYAPPAETVLVQGTPIGARPEGRLVATSVTVLAVLGGSDKASDDAFSIVIAADHAIASHLANLPSVPFLATLRPPS